MYAQTVADAVGLGNQKIFGTARFRAMSGAFGALGGDLSALQINPAGSAVFLNSQGAITLSNLRNQNDINYLNVFSNQNTSNLNFNQLGGVFIFENTNENSMVTKLSLGVAYEQTRDNFNEFVVLGTSNSSIDSYFLDAAQGIPLDALSLRDGELVSDLYTFLGETQGFQAQQAFLGYQGFVIDAADPDNLEGTSYISNLGTGSFNQEYTYRSTGFNGKFTINGGAKIGTDFYVGANLSTHFINFEKRTNYFESNTNTGSTLNEVFFTDELLTTGAGFSAQIGGIAKVNQFLRLGLALETPTWYIMQEEAFQELETFRTSDNSRFLISPNVINIFPEYEIRTPGKVTASAALVFGKEGLISLDYSYKDYATTKFDSDSPTVNFNELNSQIDNTLQGASTLRIGGEWKNGNWSFRGGYSYEQSPYKDESILGEQTGVSYGVGYNFGKMRFDFAYDRTEQNRNQALFPDSGFINSTTISTIRDQYTFTFTLNLL